MNEFEIASANVRQNSTSSDLERVAYDSTTICDTSPRIAIDPKASTITNLTCSTQCNKLATSVSVTSKNKTPNPGLECNDESWFDDMSLPLEIDSTSDHIGFNHLAHINGEKAVVGVIYPVTATTNFSIC